MIVEELIATDKNGTIKFGNHTLEQKAKVDDFAFQGDLYKVKTFKTMTKLEKNGMFLYESVPGTSVEKFQETDNGISFLVDGTEDAQITLGLADDTEYSVKVGKEDIVTMDTGLGGKISLSVTFEGKPVQIEVTK